MQFLQEIYQSFIPPPAGWLVVGVILTVAGWAAWSLWSEYKRLCLEHEEVLAAAKREIQQVENPEDVIEKLSQWSTRSELRDTLTARGIKTVLAIRETRNPDMEAILTMLDYSEVSRLNLARSAPNWLLLLGIGGTVIGLASTVVPLAPQIQAAIGAADPGVASESMAKTLEAMRHAFACSLWGILMAVLVSIGTRKVVSKQQQTVAEVQEFVLNEMAHTLLPKSEAIQLETIQRTLQQGRRFLQQTTTQIEQVTNLMKQAAHEFNNVLTSTVQRMEQIGNSLRDSAEGIQQTLLQATQSVQESTSSLAKSTDRLIDSSEQLREYHHDLRNAYAELLNLYNKSRQDLEDVITRQIEHIDRYRQEMEQLSNRMVGRLVDISSDLRDTQQHFNQAREQVLQSAMEIRDAIRSSFEQLQGGIDNILQKHHNQMVQVETRLREVVAILSQLINTNDWIVRPPTSSDQAQDETISILQKIHDKAAESLLLMQRIADLLTSTNQATQDVQQKLSQAAKQSLIDRIFNRRR